MGMSLAMDFLLPDVIRTMYFTSWSPDAFPAKSSAKLARIATKRRSRKSSNLPVIPNHIVTHRL
jgi:hypothetical protein